MPTEEELEQRITAHIDGEDFGKAILADEIETKEKGGDSD